MNRIISALILAVSATLCSAADNPIRLADSAPDRHVVVPGDTLWGIASRFLKEPWRWPEIWRLNKEQIRNPGRIFPGDVIILAQDPGGTPYLELQTVKVLPKIHESTVAQAIPSIPPNVIEPFIASPLVIEADGLERAARIVATQQDRVFVGSGDRIYVENADPKPTLWHVYRNGKPLLNPTNRQEVLGYEAYYLGTAKQVRPGHPATFEVQTAKEEIGRGDRLVPADRPVLVDYIPHKPDSAVDGRVIAIYGGVGSAGQGSIVSFSLGKADGIEVGHVLALERNRAVAGRDEGDRKVDIPVPSERVGLMFVFRSFAHISYALVLQAEDTVDVNDFVRTP